MTDLARALPLREPLRSPRRRLQAVPEPSRRRRPKLAYGIIAVAGAVAIALAQMGLSILTTQSTFEIASLTQQQRDLTLQKQALYDDVAGLSSPQYLAANAAALGMVINESPSYLRLSDGAVVGAGQPAGGASAVDAINRGAVSNALVTDTPLVTAPDATIAGTPLAPPTGGEAAADGTGSATPPPITDGLPTPATR
jgi:cell division protein FtsL